jgi:hypothetical protein
VIYLYLDRLSHWLAPRRRRAPVGAAEHVRGTAD